MSYALRLLNSFNVEFQSMEPKIHLLLLRITTVYKTILRNFVKASVINNTDDINLIDFKNTDNHIPLMDIYIGTKCELYINSATNCNIFEIKKKILSFYMEPCEQIKKRFDFKDNNLKHFAYFVPEVALSGEIGSVLPIVKLFTQYQNKAEEINEEWRLLATIPAIKFDNINDFWYKIGEMKNGNGTKMFENISNVGKAVISLPHSSANAERIFSQLNLIKNKTRNKLLVTITSALLSAKDLLKYHEKDENVCHKWEPSKTLIINRKKHILNIDEENV